jgi:hypothetical protein
MRAAEASCECYQFGLLAPYFSPSQDIRVIKSASRDPLSGEGKVHACGVRVRPHSLRRGRGVAIDGRR